MKGTVSMRKTKAHILQEGAARLSTKGLQLRQEQSLLAQLCLAPLCCSPLRTQSGKCLYRGAL